MILRYRMLFACRRLGKSYHSLDDSNSHALRLLGKPAELPEVFGWVPRCPEGAREHVIFLTGISRPRAWRGPLVKARPLPSFLETNVNETGTAFNKILAPRQKKNLFLSALRDKTAPASAIDSRRT